MADTAVWDFTDGVTAAATDRIAAVRSPGGAGDDRYLTPAYIKDYILGLANTFTRGQTITQGTANEAILTSTGYSLTGSNAQSMIDLAGTWNTTGTPAALSINITNTASNVSSMFVRFGTSGTYTFGVRVDGRVMNPSSSASGFLYFADGLTAFGRRDVGSTANTAAIGHNGVSVGISVVTGGFIGWGAHASDVTGGNHQPTVALWRGGNDTLVLARSTNAQTFYIYNTVDTPTGPTNYERARLSWNSNVFEIGTGAGGTGTQRKTSLVDAGILMPNLPTADPTVAGQLWNNSGVLTVSAG